MSIELNIRQNQNTWQLVHQSNFATATNSRKFDDVEIDWYIKKLTLNEKSLLKMYNSVIECGKSIKYVYWVKKDLFGLV